MELLEIPRLLRDTIGAVQFAGPSIRFSLGGLQCFGEDSGVGFGDAW